MEERFNMFKRLVTKAIRGAKTEKRIPESAFYFVVYDASSGNIVVTLHVDDDHARVNIPIGDIDIGRREGMWVDARCVIDHLISEIKELKLKGARDMPPGNKVGNFCKSIEQEFIKAIECGLIVGKPCLIVRENGETITAYVSNGDKYISKKIDCLEIEQCYIPQNEMARLFFDTLLFTKREVNFDEN